MKRILLTITLTLSLMTLFTNCSEEEINPAQTTQTTGSDGRGQDGEVKGF